MQYIHHMHGFKEQPLETRGKVSATIKAKFFLFSSPLRLFHILSLITWLSVI